MEVVDSGTDLLDVGNVNSVQESLQLWPLYKNTLKCLGILPSPLTMTTMTPWTENSRWIPLLFQRRGRRGINDIILLVQSILRNPQQLRVVLREIQELRSILLTKKP